MKNDLLRTCAIVALGALTLTTGANAQTFYTQNFENGSYFPGWSPNQHLDVNTTLSRFLGRYGNEAVTFTTDIPQAYLTQPANGPRGGIISGPVDGGDNGGGDGGDNTSTPQSRLQLLLTFDFYAIDSWDGSDPGLGLDSFVVFANNDSLFNETFANVHQWQSYTGEAMIDRQPIGYGANWADSAYRIAIPFDTVDESVTFSWLGHGLQGMNDESWGIDNVNLAVVTVPTPGAGAVATIALVFGVSRRRRR